MGRPRIRAGELGAIQITRLAAAATVPERGRGTTREHCISSWPWPARRMRRGALSNARWRR